MVLGTLSDSQADRSSLAPPSEQYSAQSSESLSEARLVSRCDDIHQYEVGNFDRNDEDVDGSQDLISGDTDDAEAVA